MDIEYNPKHVPVKYLDRLTNYERRILAVRVAVEEVDVELAYQLEIVERELSKAIMMCNRSGEQRAQEIREVDEEWFSREPARQAFYRPRA